MPVFLLGMVGQIIEHASHRDEDIVWVGGGVGGVGQCEGKDD